jgi:hypothetical protein
VDDFEIHRPALAKVACDHYIKSKAKPDRGGSADVAISPDVVSFVHRHVGYCDLLWGSGIRNVAGEASSVSLATGTAWNVACCTGVPEIMEAPGPSTLSGGGFPFYAVWVGGFVGAILFNLNWVCRKGDDFVTNSETAHQRAEASFKKKELQVRERAKAVADYEAAGRAVEKNTARLKALRLAKEEGDRQAAPAKKSRRSR